jgi:hypothetical protein
MRVHLLVVVVVVAAACGRDKTTETSGPGPGEGLELPALCASDTEVPPANLVCTGLYADIAAKLTAPGVEPYAPALSLWSDGADKQRWIRLPPGGVIDNSDPSEWSFPVGSKVWKEFSRGEQRVETRLWQKVHAGYWVAATYVWSGDEAGAERSEGGDIPLRDSSTYHVPTQDECQKCHRGRAERVLGFEQVSMGLPGASGLTLQGLVTAGRLSNPPARTSLVIGDDGTGAAAQALGFLHVNCGTSCHNEDTGSTAYSAGMLLRLDPTLLDGRPVNDFAALKTTVGVTVETPSWQGGTRIVAGSPEGSLLYQLMSRRGDDKQMPPIATTVVDETGDALVSAWISRLTDGTAAAAAAAPGGDSAGEASGMH